MTKAKDMKKTPLLPDRYPQQDFFVCDIFDAAPKSDMAGMEHPIFSLSTKPDFTKKEYHHGSVFVKIAPSPDGCATIHDRDILIFCISQVMAALNNGHKVERKLRFKASDLLQATNRSNSGEGYKLLQSALRRLQGTQIETNITTNNLEQWKIFSFIESSEIIKKTRNGRMLDLEIVLSDWVFNAIRANEVLTINRDYFRLRKPIERRLYEIARKHCGHKKDWSIGLELLHKKSGSKSSKREFKRSIKHIIVHDQKHDHLPDYSISYDDYTDKITFKNRGTMKAKNNLSPLPPLPTSAYEDARKVAPNYDIYQLEQEFLGAWANSGKPAPKNVKSAFIGFCKARHKAKPYP